MVSAPVPTPGGAVSYHAIEPDGGEHQRQRAEKAAERRQEPLLEDGIFSVLLITHA